MNKSWGHGHRFTIERPTLMWSKTPPSICALRRAACAVRASEDQRRASSQANLLAITMAVWRVGLRLTRESNNLSCGVGLSLIHEPHTCAREQNVCVVCFACCVLYNPKSSPKDCPLHPCFQPLACGSHGENQTNPLEPQVARNGPTRTPKSLQTQPARSIEPLYIHI
jgi:hypothetical protein